MRNPLWCFQQGSLQQTLCRQGTGRESAGFRIDTYVSWLVLSGNEKIWAFHGLRYRKSIREWFIEMICESISSQNFMK